MHAWKNKIRKVIGILKENIVQHNLIRGTFLLVLSGLTVKIIGGLNWVLLSRIIGGEGMGLYQMAYPFYLVGWRIHPILGTRKFHSGVDLGYDYNQPILAAFSGVVIYAANYSRAGNTVIIRHDEGTYTLYGHCSKLLVTMGEPVRAGQLIALAGSTGYSTGPHLHFEIWQNGVFIDPMNYIQK